MAGDGFDYGSLSEPDQQEFLYETIGFGEPAQDQYAHDLFYEAFYDDELSMSNRIDLMDQLIDYLYETYGIDLEEVWDWDDFRAWYGAS